MSDIVFENHTKLTEKLPIIFHHNVRKKETFYAPNWHENIEILRITYGEGVVVCGNKRLKAQKDDIFVISTNLVHAITSDTHLEYECLIIDRDFANSFGINTDRLSFTYKISNDDTLINLFDAICPFIKNNSSFSYAGLCGAVLSFLSYLSQNHSFEVQEENSSNDYIKEALRYIKKNLKRNITLDEIAANTGVSKYHFIRKFKEITGYTPLDYITRLRCQIAKALLKDKKYSVKEISIMVGYDNPSYFSKVFKSVTGKSPSDYN